MMITALLQRYDCMIRVYDIIDGTGKETKYRDNSGGLGEEVDRMQRNTYGVFSGEMLYLACGFYRPHQSILLQPHLFVVYSSVAYRSHLPTSWRTFGVFSRPEGTVPCKLSNKLFILGLLIPLDRSQKHSK